MTEKHISQIRIGVVSIVLLVSGVVYLILPFAAVRWAQTPFLGFLMDPNQVSSDIEESNWPAKQIDLPIQYPERLLTIDEMPVNSSLELQNILATRQVEDEVSLSLTQPVNSRVTAASGLPAQRTVTIPLSRLGAGGIWNQFWIFYLVGIFILIIGVWAFRVRPDAEAAQWFALLTASGALAVGALFDMDSTQYFVRLWIFALSLFGSFNVLLVFVFPYEIEFVGRHPWLKGAILLPGLVIAIWAQLWLQHPTDPWAYAVPWRAAYGLNGIALVGSLAVLAYRGIRSSSPLARQQIRLILIGAVLAFTPLITFFVLAASGNHYSWLTVMVYIPPVVIYPLAIGYTIVRYRLLDMDIVLRQGLASRLLTLFLMAALTVGVSSLSAILAPYLDFNNPILLSIFIVVLALVFDPLRNRLQKGLEQTFFRQPLTFDELLRSYNRELKTAVHADQVAKILLQYAETGIPNTQSQLYLPDNKMSCYSGYNGRNSPLVEINSPVIEFMRGQTGVIDLAEERAWPYTFRQHHETVAALQSAAIVPMNNSNELLGWLSLSPKKDNQRFTQSELSYLSSLADQSLIGLERANVIRRLEARIAELDLLSQFSQHLNFTIDFDDLLELAYVNYQRLLALENFVISWRDPETEQIYTAFYVEDGERIHEKEGRNQIVSDARILQVVQTGQLMVTEVDDCSWIIAPLNAGADTLGTLHTFSREPGQKLLQREEQLFGVFADRTAVALDRLQTRYQLEKRAQQLEIINEVTGSLASTLELEPLLNLILDKAIQLLDTEAGTFMLTIEDTGELEFRVVRGPTSEDLLGKRLTIGTGLAGTAAQSGRPVLVNRVQDDKRWFNQVDASTDFQSQSILTVPLIRGSAVLGVVQVINKQNGAPFDDEDQQLLTAFAGQAVVALENARLWEQTDKELQERVNELFMLQQLDRDLNTTLDLDHILNLTLDRILRICGGSAGAIVLTNRHGQPQIRAARNYERAFDTAAGNDDVLQMGLIGRVLRTGEAHVTGNVHEEPDYVSASYSTHTQMTIPIIHKQKLIGAIAIEGDKLGLFDEVTLETAVRVTNHASVAITNAILYEQVQEANEAKSEFVSMVSHELKTPMTSVGGYTDLMLSGMTGDLTEQQQNFLETISVNIKRMGQLIQDLTDISRIETKHLHVEVAPVSFTNIISDTLQIIRGPCDGKSIHLHLDLPSDLPLVFGDKERLVQVTTNLLSNACKYSPPGTNVYVTVREDMISPKPDAPAVPMVTCSIRDEGYGISDEDQQQLFTKFFRADDPNIRKATGTGLGLSITKGIVELHNGRIWVESEVNRGTTFHFAIPQPQ